MLDLQPATVKTRLHRARKLIKDSLEAQIGPVLIDAFPFAGKRCDRLADAVLKDLVLISGNLLLRLASNIDVNRK